MIKKVSAFGLVLLLLVPFSNCSSPTADEIVMEWQGDGWAKVAIHGKVGPIERHGQLSSQKAQAIEASWVERGVRKTKVYPQKSHLYLVLRFFKEDGDQFVVVMKKRK